MIKPLLAFLDPLLQPADRIRMLCLLMLMTLVTAMLYGGAQSGIEAMIPTPPWDKLAHMVAFGGFAALAWVVMGAQLHVRPILVAGVISLVDEGLQHYTPGRTADPSDIVADLAGATAAILLLRLLRMHAMRMGAVSLAGEGRPHTATIKGRAG